MKSPFLKELQARGLLFQASDLQDLDELMLKDRITVYIGFDPTASSLHVGNLSQIMILRLLKKHNHNPIAIMGGATARIGDPSGKDEARQLISDETIDNNIKSIKQSFLNILKINDGDDFKIFNNNDWLKQLNYLEFLTQYGRHFSINRMLSFDSVKSRLDREQPLSFLEFNYMILQAYDFMYLSKNYNCVLQIGGSDQWGNIINGIELNKKILNKKVFGITSPLITTSDGKKMGKTANGAVWLNEDKLSNYDYWQFWRNTSDQDVIKYLKIFTDIDLEEIDKYSNYEGSQLNKLKILLADEATKLCRGDDCLSAIHKQIDAGFINKSIDDLEKITLTTDKNSLIFDILFNTNLFNSKSELRKLIQGNGIKIDDAILSDGNNNINKNEFKLSIGKKRHYLIVLNI